jgi:hypothetical protein
VRESSVDAQIVREPGGEYVTTALAANPLCLAMPHTENGIEDFAMRVRALLGIGPGVIFDYLELFENAGLRVIFAPLPGEVESAACHDPVSENAFLFVSTAGPATAERQLFRLVCELGRIYCHTGGVRQVAGRATPNPTAPGAFSPPMAAWAICC